MGMFQFFSFPVDKERNSFLLQLQTKLRCSDFFFSVLTFFLTSIYANQMLSARLVPFLCVSFLSFRTLPMVNLCSVNQHLFYSNFQEEEKAKWIPSERPLSFCFTQVDLNPICFTGYNRPFLISTFFPSSLSVHTRIHPQVYFISLPWPSFLKLTKLFPIP